MKRLLLICLLLVGCASTEPRTTSAGPPEKIRLQTSAKLSRIMDQPCGEYIRVSRSEDVRVDGMYMTFHLQDDSNLMVRSDGLKVARREGGDLPLLEYRKGTPPNLNDFEYTIVVTPEQFAAAPCLAKLSRGN